MPQNRLKYEFAYLTDTTSAGFTNAFPGLPVTGSTTDGAQWHDGTEYMDDPDQVRFTFGLSENEADISQQLSSIGITKAISSEYSAFNVLYQYIRGWLIDHPDAAINSIQVRITDVACQPNGKSLGIWQIDTEQLDWCEDGECHLNFSLKEYTPLTNCLQTTFIWDNHRGWFPPDGFIVGNDPITGLPNEQFMHPRFRYCDDIKPQFLQNFLFSIALGLVAALAAIINPIVAIAQAIQTIWNAVFGSGTTDFADDLEDTVNEIYEDWFEALLGCGKLHPSPLVRNYFINACSKCGLEFQSNIFNDPFGPYNRYYNTCHLFAPETYGLNDDSNKDWIQRNKPNYTATTYAFSLKDMFNAKYKVENGVFYFHRRDTFPDEIVFDFAGDDAGLVLEGVCYNAQVSEPRYASTYWKLSHDADDPAGNEALHRYNGVKIWSTDTKRFSGYNEVNFQDYGATRFTNDGIDRKLPFVNLSQAPFWPDSYILLEKDTTALGKLLIWDGIAKNEADVQRVDFPDYVSSIWAPDWEGEWIMGGPFNPNYNVFNYGLFFNPHAEPGYENLYHMHEIDDPTQSTLLNKTWKVTLELCCDTLDRIVYDDTSGDGVQAHLDYLVQLPYNEKGKITQVDVVYTDRGCYIELRGEIKYTI